MKSECRGYTYHISLFCLLLAAVVFLAGCTNSEQKKAQHLARGEAYLKDSKFQEASLEFRNALQIDEKLVAGHWGLARASEELGHLKEMVDELITTVRLDQNKEILDARIKLGNYYIRFGGGKTQNISEAERLGKEVLDKDPNNIEGHILMGAVFFAQKQKDKAFAELNHAIEIDPKRVESYLSLARYYIVTNERDKAEEIYKRAISVNGNAPLAHIQYGEFLAQSNRQQEAEAELRKAIEVAPGDRSARFTLAGFYLYNKQPDKAEEAFKALVALEPDKPESQILLGDFYYTINRPDDAVKVYQNILAKSPDYVQARYRFAEILIARNDLQGANAQLEEVFKKDKNDMQALLVRARLHARSQEPDSLQKAIEDLKEVLKQDPNSQKGLYQMAEAHLNLNLIEQARTFAADLERNYPDYLPAKFLQLQITMAGGDYKAAVPLASDLLARLDKAPPDQSSSQLLAEIREKTYISRGYAQLRLTNVTAARQDFESARQIAPNDPRVYNNLALASVAENKLQDAITSFENAVRLDATNYEALNGLISLHAKNQELDKAHASIDQALSAYPNVASLHYLKAQVYGFQRNAQSVEAELNRAVELDPNYLNAYSALAALYINTKQEDRAIAQYQKIIALRPENAAAYTMIGMLEYQRGNNDAAIENYRKALEKDPNASVAANNLAYLYADTGKGNLDEAVRLAQGVVQKFPQAGFIDTLGWVYYKKKLHSAAVEQFRQAVSVNEAQARAGSVSPSATYHYHLAMALKETGNKDESRRELQTAIRLSEKVSFAEIEEAKRVLASL